MSSRSGSRDQPKRSGSGQENPHEPTRSEWIIGIMSGLLILSIMGLLLWEATAGANGLPDLQVEAGRIHRQGSSYLVEFTARNDGGEAAKSLEVEGVLMDGQREVEKSTATVAYVPPQSTRRGGLIFSEDPQAYRLELRALGYERP